MFHVERTVSGHSSLRTLGRLDASPHWRVSLVTWVWDETTPSDVWSWVTEGDAVVISPMQQRGRST